MTTAGNFAQWYFADPGLRSDGATASMIIFFSSGVRSRWPMLAPAVGVGASLDARGVCRCPMAHPESAKPTASWAIMLKDVCKARAPLRQSALFCLITVANIRQRRVAESVKVFATFRIEWLP